MKKRRITGLVVSFSLAVAALLALPLTSSGVKVAGVDLDELGNGVNNLLGGAGGAAQQAGGGSGASGAGGASNAAPQADTRAGVPPNYIPPLHGTNAHGQGDVATVEIPPGATNPYTGTPSQPESIIVGRSKGEQNADGSYHGHITIAALLGAELLGVDSTEGQSNTTALDPLNDMILDQICTGSGGQLCLGVLEANSTTTPNGSTNDYSTLNTAIGGPAGISAGVAESQGNISDDGTCQTASGSSNVANANVGGALSADAAQGNSQSVACNNGFKDVQQNSNVVNLQEGGVPVPAPGCANGTPDTNFTPLTPLASAVCNADDANAGQTSDPYGVRESLTVFLLAGAIKLTTAGPESHAVAPPPAGPPTGGNPPLAPSTTGGGGGGGGGGGRGGGGGNNNGGDGPGDGADDGGPLAGEAQAGRDNLAFTGTDLLLIALFGLALVGSGLALSAAARRVYTSRPRLH